MIFVAETSDGGKITYRDTKRYLWFFSVLSPTVPGICSIILLMGEGVFWAAVPLLFYYGVIPILDMIVGEDTNKRDFMCGRYRKCEFAGLGVCHAGYVRGCGEW